MEQFNNLNILLVEDDEDDYVIFKEYLRDVKFRNTKLEWCSSYEKALEVIRSKKHDIYFIDYLLGAHTGIELLTFCRNIEMDHPVIILTGLGSRETDMHAMNLGADDYLIKADLDAEKLERCIRYTLEQNRAVKIIRENEEKYRTIFENSHDVIYIADRHGNILEINKAGERLFGYSREEILGMNAGDLYENPKDRDRFLEAINRTGNYSNFETTLVDKTGNKKFCSLTASIQRVDEKGNIFYQGIVHDMTRRKKAENELAIAEKLALTGRVARTMAHEIRNPLTNINLAVEQLEEDVKNEETLSYFDIIKRNSKRIADLVTELMENSKPADIKSSRIPIHNLLNKTIALANDRAALKNVKINTDFTGENALLEGDEAKLTLAFLNIIINAIEAVEENKGTINIKSDCKDKQCLVIIEDNGCGIPRENLGKIFDPYYSGKLNGMGLGLAATHNVIYSHKGNIDVESDSGKGTRFSIVLNLV